MLHITDISKSFGSQILLDGASLHVRPGMRIGLVGPNGAGKTTLLRLIVGEMSLDGGEISGRKDLRIGFLPQEIEEIADHAVIEEVLASHAEVLSAERRMIELGQQISQAYAAPAMGTAPAGASAGEAAGRVDAEQLLQELGALQTGFESVHGYELETRAQTILRGMGFKETDFARPIAELSGGWRMRVALSRLLLEQPDLLLMDEPTNHLDLESLIWLEEFLLSWPGSLVVISHDRYFLNRMVTHIADLDRGSSTSTQGTTTIMRERNASATRPWPTPPRISNGRSSRPRPSSGAFGPRTPKPSRCSRRSANWSAPSASTRPAWSARPSGSAFLSRPVWVGW